MKNPTNLKPAIMLYLAVAFCAICFTSTTTDSKSTNNTVAELSLKIEKLNAKVLEMEAEEGPSDGSYIGDVILFAGEFAPNGWAKCEGQLLLVAQNQQLFSVIGTRYGGNGSENFALPDLRGRSAVGARAGPGLSNINVGAKRGGDIKVKIDNSGTSVSSGQVALTYIINLTGQHPMP